MGVLQSHPVLSFFLSFRQMLVEKNEMHEYETPLPFGLITPRHDETKDLIKCPFYANFDRSSKNKTSSFLCYIPMVSNIPEDLVFKKSIMLAIDDSNEEH